MFEALAAAILVFVFYIVLNAVLFRTGLIKRPLVSLTLTGLLCLPLLYFAVVWMNSLHLMLDLPAPMETVVFALLIFGVIFFGYLHAWALIDISITMKMLVHIFLSPSKSLTLEELESDYPLDQVLRAKIEETIRTGFLKESTVNGQRAIAPGSIALLTGRFFDGLKRFCRWGVGG